MVLISEFRRKLTIAAICIVLLFSCSDYFIDAGVRGTVVDESSEPIGGVLIELREIEDQTPEIRTAYTDEAGEFSVYLFLPINEENIETYLEEKKGLKFEKEGHQSVEIILEDIDYWVENPVGTFTIETNIVMTNL